MSGMHWSVAISQRVPDKMGTDPASEARVLMGIADQLGITDPLPAVTRLLARERELERLQMEARREARSVGQRPRLSC
jgi:hypothetical protein